MPTVQKLFRFADDFAEKYVFDAKQKGMNETEYVEKAIEHFLKCHETDIIQSMKPIVLMYDGYCLKCSHEVKAGSWALYGRGIGIICMDCYVLQIGDKALLLKDQKMRQIKRLMDVYQKECDRLAAKCEIYTAREKLQAMVDQWERLMKVATEYLTQKLGQPDEKQAFEDFLNQKKRFEEMLNDCESFIKEQLKAKKWMRRAIKDAESASQ